MSEPKIHFKIIPAQTREVTREEKVEATLFFDIPECDFPRSVPVEVTVDKLTVNLSHGYTNAYDGRATGDLFLNRFGYFGGSNPGPSDMITRLMAARNRDTITEAFRQLAQKLTMTRSVSIPPTAINLMNSGHASTPPPPSKPAWFDLQPAETRVVQETVQDPDDIYFHVETVPFPREVTRFEKDGLELIFSTNTGARCNKRKSFRPTRFIMNGFGYFSESSLLATPRAQKAVRKLRADHSDEKIEAAFQEFALQLLEESSKKRKAPPPDAHVWTPTMVTEISLSKRLKATEIKSESMTD